MLSDISPHPSEQIHCPNSLTPDSGSGLNVFVTYSRGRLTLSRVRGVAMGVLWSLGTPHLGSSGGTGGAIIGTEYAEYIFVNMTSKILNLWVNFVTMFFSLGIPVKSVEIFRSFLSPPSTNPAFGYFERRKWIVDIKWSSNLDFFLELGGE